MAFEFYHAPPPPAPDWGAAVQAELGARERNQRGWAMLINALQEDARLKQSAAQFHENKRIDNANLALKSRGLDLEQSGQDIAQDRIASEDERAANAQTGEWARTLASQLGQNARNRAIQDRMVETAKMRQDAQQQAAAHKDAQREEEQQAIGGLTNSFLEARRGFEPHKFTAGEALMPGFGVDPARDYRSVLSATGGDPEAAQDLMKRLSSASVQVAVAPPGWHEPILGKFGAKVKPEDAHRIAKMTLGVDSLEEVPHDLSAAQERARAHFAQFPEFKNLSERLGPQKPAAQTQKPTGINPGGAAFRDPGTPDARAAIAREKAMENAAKDPEYKTLMQAREQLLKSGGDPKQAEALLWKARTIAQTKYEQFIQANGWNMAEGGAASEEPAKSIDEHLDDVMGDHPDWDEDQIEAEVSKRAGLK